jgi:hypothetical protein
VQQSPVFTSPRTILEDKCITALFILLILIGAFLIPTGSAFAASASANIPATGYCSQPKSNGHCYATVDWHGSTGGAFTNLSPYGSLYCGGCGGFIDNEMWLSDTTSSQCVSAGGCWVEAGIEAMSAQDAYDCTPGSNSTCLFWADARPNGGGFHHHSLYHVGDDGTSLDPWYFFVWIRNANNNTASGNSWSVKIEGYWNQILTTTQTGLSTNNSMAPLDIEIGSELYAANGDASAGQNDFQYNQWLDSNGNWHEQTALANFNGTNGPPYGSWTDLPNSTNGGIWSTSD